MEEDTSNYRVAEYELAFQNYIYRDRLIVTVFYYSLAIVGVILGVIEGTSLNSEARSLLWLIGCVSILVFFVSVVNLDSSKKAAMDRVKEIEGSGKRAPQLAKRIKYRKNWPLERYTRGHTTKVMAISMLALFVAWMAYGYWTIWPVSIENSPVDLDLNLLIAILITLTLIVAILTLIVAILTYLNSKKNEIRDAVRGAGEVVLRGNRRAVPFLEEYRPFGHTIIGIRCLERTSTARDPVVVFESVADTTPWTTVDLDIEDQTLQLIRTIEGVESVSVVEDAGKSRLRIVSKSTDSAECRNMVRNVLGILEQESTK